MTITKIHVIHKTEDIQRYVPAHLADSFDVSEWLVDPDLTNVQGSPPHHWLVINDEVVLKDQAGIDAADLAFNTGRANAIIEQFSDKRSIVRAVVLALVDILNDRATDFNTLRQGIEDATSLASVQAVAAGITPQNDTITPIQARNFIRARLDNLEL